MEGLGLKEEMGLMEGGAAERSDVEGCEVQEPVATVLHRRAAARLTLFLMALVALGGAALALAPRRATSQAASAAVAHGGTEELEEAPARIPNLHYIGMGYNIFKANPLSSDSFDPGFTTYQLFDFTWSSSNVWGLDAPTSVMVTESTACSLQMRTATSESERAYQKALTNSIGADVSLGLEDAFSAAYKGNMEFQKNVENVINKRQKLTTSTAQCSVYAATLDHFKLPPMSRQMKNALSHLPTEYGDGSKYFEFIDFVGSHHLARLTLGARYGLTFSVSESSQESLRKSGVDIEQEASVSYDMVEATLTSGSSSSTEEETDVSKYMKEQQVVTIGGRPPSGGRSDWLEQSRKSPMPIQYALMPLTEVMRNQVDYVIIENMKTAYRNYCTDHLGLSKQQCGGSGDSKQCMWDSDCKQHGGTTMICTEAGTCRSGCVTKQNCPANAFCRKGKCEHLCDHILTKLDHGGVLLGEKGTDTDKIPGHALNKDRCKTYAHSQGYSFENESSSDYPKGCYLYGPDSVYYNTHHRGGSDSNSRPITAPWPSSNNAFTIDWQRTTSTGAPTYWSTSGTHFIFYCESFDKWDFAAHAAANWERLQAGVCFRNLNLLEGEPLIDFHQSISKGRKFDAFTGHPYEWVHPHPGLQIQCQSCDHVRFSGFKKDYMNVAWSKDSDKIWKDASGNNWMYFCPKDGKWYITNYHEKAIHGAEGGDCSGWSYSHDSSFLTPVWNDWDYGQADKSLWVTASCFTA